MDSHWTIAPSPEKKSKPPLWLKLRSSKLLIAITIFVATFTDGFVYGIIVPVLPFSLVNRSGVAENQVQFWTSTLLAVHGAAMLVTSPIAGWFADRGESRKPSFLAGLALVFGATILFAAGTSPAMLVAARFFQGSSSGIVFTVGLALLADTVGRDEVGQWLGFVLSGLSLGLMIAPFLGGIVYAKAGYITVFIMVLGVIAFDFLLRVFMIEKKDAEKYTPTKKTQDPKSVAKYGTISHQRTGSHEQRTEASPDHEPHRETNSIESNRTTGEEDLLISSSSSTVSQYRRISNQNSFFSRRFPAYSSLLGSPRLMAAVYGSFINTTIICAFDGVLPLFVHRTFGWDSIGAGVIFLPITVPALLGPLIGALSDRFGPRTVALGGFALAAPSIALLGLVTHNSVEQAVLLCCLLTVAGFGTNMIFTPLAADMSVVVDTLDREESGVFGDAGAYAQAYGLFDGALAAGTVFGPAFAGLMYQQIGWAAAVGTLAAVCVTGTLPVILYTGGSTREREEVEE